MKAKFVNENINKSSYKLNYKGKNLFDTQDKNKIISYLISLKNERPLYFDESKLIVNNVELEPKQFLFINKNTEEDDVNLLIKIYSKVKKLLPKIKIYFSKPSGYTSNGAILIKYSDINSNEKDLLFKEFDIESDDFYITDDAGPNEEYVGIYLNSEENYND